MRSAPSIDGLTSKGKRVLVRVDLNVPMDERQGHRRHPHRAQSRRPSREIADKGGKVILLAPFRPPEGHAIPKDVAEAGRGRRWPMRSGGTVAFADDCIGAEGREPPSPR